MRLLLAALLLAAAPACALDEDEAVARSGLLRMGGFNLGTIADAPLGLLGAVGSEIPKNAARLGELRGRACQYGVGVPYSLNFLSTINGVGGKGSFEKAIADIKKKQPDVEGLYDLKVDVHITGVLGIFRRQCIELSGRGWKRA